MLISDRFRVSIHSISMIGTFFQKIFIFTPWAARGGQNRPKKGCFGPKIGLGRASGGHVELQSALHRQSIYQCSIDRQSTVSNKKKNN